jgi:hypothetical protein
MDKQVRWSHFFAHHGAYPVLIQGTAGLIYLAKVPFFVL